MRAKARKITETIKAQRKTKPKKPQNVKTDTTKLSKRPKVNQIGQNLLGDHNYAVPSPIGNSDDGPDRPDGPIETLSTDERTNVSPNDASNSLSDAPVNVNWLNGYTPAELSKMQKDDP